MLRKVGDLERQLQKKTANELGDKGEACGLIILDSKNRQSWQRSFATKLSQDQLAAGADHAILSTTVFPAGKKELYIEEGVIAVNPGRAAHIVQILRNGLVKMHVRGLTNKEKKDKINRLYQLMTSDHYAQRFAKAGNLTQDILDLDVQEQEGHRKVWKKRGLLATQLKNVLNDIDGDVSSIVEGPGADVTNSQFALQEAGDGVSGQ